MTARLKEHIPPAQVDELRAETEAALRAQLSTIVDTDDDPTTLAADVLLFDEPAEDGGVWVCAFLDGDPTVQPPASSEDDGRVFAELEV